MVCDSKESQQKLIDVVHGYSNRCNVCKSVVMVFSKNSVESGWEHKLPKASGYTSLGMDFACNGAWDVHLSRVLDSGKKMISCIVLSVTAMSIWVLVRCCYCLLLELV